MTQRSQENSWSPDDEAIQELAASGALCERCGALCIPSIDLAILALTSANRNGVTIPWCRCDDCEMCRPLRDAVLRIRESRIDPRNPGDPNAP
jgi:hypothetical protein